MQAIQLLDVGGHEVMTLREVPTPVPCISSGPRGPAVRLFWLSAMGMPLVVVIAGRLAIEILSPSCCDRRDLASQLAPSGV